MFIVTARMPKRRYFLFGALAVLALLIAALALKKENSAAAESAELRAETNEQRVAYLSSLGWEVEAEPVEAIRLTLPAELVEPYRAYNELQAQQGFDLTPYLGETLERFTYTVTNHPAHPRGCQADLYLFEGTVVAGDVICTGEGGFISTLEFPAQG